MNRLQKHPDPHRPLVSRGAALSLAGAVACLLGGLWPLAVDRQRQAALAGPDLLSLVYLKLGLAEAPGDQSLRLTLGEKNLEAGLFEAARDVVEPLAAGTGASGARARDLLVDAEFQAWAALAASDLARAGARQRWNAAVARLDLEAATGERLEQLASAALSTGQPALAASLLCRLALREPVSEALVERADAAWLAAGSPARAAELHAQLAERLPLARAAEHAARALERMLRADDAAAALRLFERLAGRFPSDQRLLALGLRTASGGSDRTQLALAERLLVLRPQDADLRRRIADLADFTGDSGRAGREYAWLASHGGGALDRRRALERARATSDLRLALELSPRDPADLAGVVDRVSLHEALGDVDEALALLDRALGGPLGAELSLWQLQLELRRRAGDLVGAVETLEAIEQRFPGALELSLHADLLLAQGKTRQALRVLGRPGAAADANRMRQLSMLAWELGDAERARAAYAALVALPGATLSDYQRLWLLHDEAHDPAGSLDVALRAWERFHEPGLLGMAIYSATAWRRTDLVQELLKRAELAGDHFAANPAYWQLRVQLQLDDAEHARQGSQYGRAREALAESAGLLERAGAYAPADSYAALERRQRHEEFALALENDDKEALARLYPSEVPRLEPRARVNVLYRLGRNEEAAELALAGARRGDLPIGDRELLADDAQSLTADKPRYLALGTSYLQLEGLREIGAGARITYTSWAETGLSAELGLSELLWGEAPPFGAGALHELSLGLGGRFGTSSVSLGATLQDFGAPRPFARFEQPLWRAPERFLELRVRANDRSQETAALRVLGVEDEIALSMHRGLGERFFVNARAAGKLYSSRDRDYLGAGLDLEAAVGKAFPSELGTASVRVSALFDPRFPADAEAEATRPAGVDRGAPLGASAPAPADALFTPVSSLFVGVGSALVRGDLAAPRVDQGGVAVALDGAAGYLVLSDELGWWLSARVGVPIAGGDLISLSARAGNVLGGASSLAVFGVSAEYAVSQW